MIPAHEPAPGNVPDAPVPPKLPARIDGPLEQVSAELPLKRHWSERQWRRIRQLCLPSGHSCQGCAPCHPTTEGGGDHPASRRQGSAPDQRCGRQADPRNRQQSLEDRSQLPPQKPRRDRHLPHQNPDQSKPEIPHPAKPENRSRHRGELPQQLHSPRYAQERQNHLTRKGKGVLRGKRVPCNNAEFYG